MLELHSFVSGGMLVQAALRSSLTLHGASYCYYSVMNTVRDGLSECLQTLRRINDAMESQLGALEDVSFEYHQNYKVIPAPDTATCSAQFDAVVKELKAGMRVQKELHEQHLKLQKQLSQSSPAAQWIKDEICFHIAKLR